VRPAQCGLYRGPRPGERPVPWFYRGFNRAYGALEGRYVALVRRMTARPRLMTAVFLVAVAFAGVWFARQPTAFLPVEDQGYGIVVGRLPPGAAQPRVRELASAIDAVLADMAGVKGWVTSGGYSALDSAVLSNAVTTYVMYDDWERRPRGFSQASFLAALRERLQAIRTADFAVLVPPPIPGLGGAGGFEMMLQD